MYFICAQIKAVGKMSEEFFEIGFNIYIYVHAFALRQFDCVS